jgi:hypothetical protein
MTVEAKDREIPAYTVARITVNVVQLDWLDSITTNAAGSVRQKEDFSSQF